MSTKITNHNTKRLNNLYKKIRSLHEFEQFPMVKDFSSLFSAPNNSRSYPSIDIAQFMLPQSAQTMAIERPAFNPKINYQTLSTNFEATIKKNLDSLKDISLLSNMYESQTQNQKKSIIDTIDQVPITGNFSNEVAGIKRYRRRNDDIFKALDCPFLGCCRVYGSRTALKFHIKRSHKINDPTKKNLKHGLTSILTSTSTKGVDYDRVIVKKFKSEDSDSVIVVERPDSCQLLSSAQETNILDTSCELEKSEAESGSENIDRKVLVRNHMLKRKDSESKKAATNLRKKIKKDAAVVSTEVSSGENDAQKCTPPVSAKKIIVTKARTTTPSKSALRIDGAKQQGALTETSESVLPQATEFRVMQCNDSGFDTLSSKLDQQSVSVNMNVQDNRYEFGGMIRFQNEEYMGQDSDALSSNSFDEYMLNDNGWMETGPIDYHELLSSTNSHCISKMESCERCQLPPTKKFITESDHQGRKQSFSSQGQEDCTSDFLIRNC
jgi:hypothetical protein